MTDAPPAPVAVDRPRAFVGLDGLRGFAALIVVVWHARKLFGFFPASGYLAVDLFFVLSGFVIAHAYEGKLSRGMGWMSFMRVRLIRLYPLYALGFVATLAALGASLALGRPISWPLGALAASTLFSVAFLPTPPGLGPNANLYPLNAPAWSLGFELIVNLAFVLAWRWLSLRVLIAIALIAAAAQIIAGVYYGSLNTGAIWDAAAGGFPRVFYSFTVGVILLRLHRRRPLPWALGSLAPVVVMIGLLLAAPPANFRIAYDLAATLVAFPLLVFAAASARATFTAPLYGFLGLTSYAVYALHIPLYAIFESVAVRVLHGRLEAATPWLGVAFVALVVLVAFLADKAFDAPVRRWLTARTGPGLG